MGAQYDAIAEKYQRTKGSPLRTYVEAHTFLGLIGDLHGKRVLDLACGEGFYTRQLKKLGAMHVVGQIHTADGHAAGMFQGIDGFVVQQPPKGLAAVLLEKIARVGAIGQYQNPQVEVLGDEKLQDLVGAALPGFVAIENQHNSVHEPPLVGGLNVLSLPLPWFELCR